MTLWNDAENFKQVYFTRFPGVYYAGDYAMRDDDGYFWLLGRADEVLKVAGHRIGTIELEDSLISHPAVAESAVIGKSDPVKMEVPVAFVVLKPEYAPTPELRKELMNHVRTTIGPIAVPEAIYFVSRLPKTRSAKIMRRVVRAVVEGKPIGDITTLEDETSVEEMKNAYGELQAEISKAEPAK
jgi:acetyl-CoA synthetase